MIGIIGYGGHAKVITDLLKRLNPNETFQYFSKTPLKHNMDLPNLTEDHEQQLQKYLQTIEKWHVAIGDPHIRKAKIEWLIQQKATIISAIHEKSTIGENVQIDIGTSVMAGSIINPFATIGKGCIINTASSIDHDCKIADYVNIGPGCHLAGGVKIGTLSNLGTGAIVIPNISIGNQCIIGAGAVVICDIPDNSIAVGVPAKIIKKNN